jgi:alanine racemase
MELVSQISHIRKVAANTPVSYGSLYKTKQAGYIATIPCGYADGFLNSFTNREDAIAIGDRRYPIAGFVCMDQLMVDLGPHCLANIYDKVSLFGPNAPAHNAQSLTQGLANLSPYMLLTAISARVPRLVIEA